MWPQLAQHPCTRSLQKIDALKTRQNYVIEGLRNCHPVVNDHVHLYHIYAFMAHVNIRLCTRTL